MKKLFAGMVVSIMLIGMMGTTVFAATSPTANTALTQITEQNATQKADAASVAVTISKDKIKVLDSNYKSVNVTTEAIDAVTWNDGTTAVTTKFGSDATVIAAAEIKTDTISGTATVSLNLSDNISSVRSTDVVHVLHKENGSWVDIATVSGADLKKSGYITLKMSSFSPIMVACVPATASSLTNSSQNSTQDSTQNSTQDSTQNSTQDDQNVSSDDSADDYTQGYNDGYEAGVNSVSNTNSSASSGSSKKSGKNSSKTVKNTVTRTIYRTGNTTTSPVNTSTTSPKTGASLPALPFVAMFAFAGLLVCNKKGHKQ